MTEGLSTQQFLLMDSCGPPHSAHFGISA